MNVFDDEGELEVVQKVLEKTLDGSLTWGQGLRGTVKSDHVFFCHTDKFIYLISSLDSDDSHPFSFQIRRTGTKTDLHSTRTDQGSEALDLIRDLYVFVKRRVLRLDEVPNEILADLDNPTSVYGDEEPF